LDQKNDGNNNNNNIRETHEIIGYDRSPLTNITTMFLLGIEEYDIPPQNINKSLEYVHSN